MITLSLLKEPVFVSSSRLITSDIGEIVKIEDGSSRGCYLEFYDSIGLAFCTPTMWNTVRYYSVCTISPNRERNDLIPEKYKDFPKIENINCNDPRVIWACIVSLWIATNRPKDRNDSNEVCGKILTSLLPTYQEASVWMVRNRFQLFTTTNEMYDKICSPSGSLYREPYYKDYSALKTPPKIDWSIFPDRKDS